MVENNVYTERLKYVIELYTHPTETRIPENIKAFTILGFIAVWVCYPFSVTPFIPLVIFGALIMYNVLEFIKYQKSKKIVDTVLSIEGNP